MIIAVALLALVAARDPNLLYTCETIRALRPQIEKLSPERREQLARRFRVSPAQRRAAQKCLDENDGKI